MLGELGPEPGRRRHLPEGCGTPSTVPYLAGKMEKAEVVSLGKDDASALFQAHREPRGSQASLASQGLEQMPTFACLALRPLPRGSSLSSQSWA